MRPNDWQSVPFHRSQKKASPSGCWRPIQPFFPMPLHEAVIVEVGVSGVNPLDFPELARAQTGVWVQGPDASNRP
jgi:hypothetical protein